MKINNRVLFLLVIIATIIIPAKSFAQSDYEKQTAAFSIDLAKKIKESGKTKVAVSDFLDNDGNLTELGKAIAEDIGVGIVNEGKGAFQVMERSNLNAILKEQKLSSTGLIDPETAKKLGKLKMVDAVIVGNITPFGNSFRITIKILDTETGMSIAATAGNLAGTEDIKGLFNKKITIFNPPSSTINPDTSKCYKCKGKGTILVQRACSRCEGTGKRKCIACNGIGIATSITIKECASCNGNGYITCSTCNGKKVESTSETCPICNGTGENNTGTSANLRFKETIQNDNTASKDIQGCETKNTGDFCFTNARQKNVEVRLGTGDELHTLWGEGKIRTITLAANQTQCFYNLPATNFTYIVYDGPAGRYNDLQKGQIYVEKCKSKTYVIK